MKIIRTPYKISDPHWFCFDRSIYTDRIIAVHVGPIMIWFREVH
jgi:hypothetical protein